MTKPVIVGTDGSDSARLAVQAAAALADALGLPLRVVCAYEKFEVAELREGGDTFTLASDLDALTVAQTEAGRLTDTGIEVTAEAIHGKPADALIESATRHHAALIVVGNKRVQGVARILGSVASSVAAKAPCDVYIAHTH